MDVGCGVSRWTFNGYKWAKNLGSTNIPHLVGFISNMSMYISEVDFVGKHKVPP